ncbi:MAG TPA: MarR family transcriptional regulator, partial [Rhizomicrobium sp.]
GLLDILSISKQALSAPLRQLTEKKLVALSADEKDRRVRRLALSAEGKALEAELTGTQMKHLSTGFAKAGAGAEAGWRRVMDALAELGK